MSREKSGGLSVTTLLLASASAATAAIVVPLVWEGGGVVAAAITPIIVTLTSEALKRPVEKVQTVAVWRRTPQGTAIRECVEVAAEPSHDPFGLREPERRTVLTPRRVRLALVTAALAFALAAVVVTASELAVFGDSVSSDHRTTFFGGKLAEKADATATPAPSREPGASATPAPSEAPPATPTAAPSEGAESTPAPNSAAPGESAAPAPTP